MNEFRFALSIEFQTHGPMVLLPVGNWDDSLSDNMEVDWQIMDMTDVADEENTQMNGQKTRKCAEKQLDQYGSDNDGDCGNGNHGQRGDQMLEQTLHGTEIGFHGLSYTFSCELFSMLHTHAIGLSHHPNGRAIHFYSRALP